MAISMLEKNEILVPGRIIQGALHSHTSFHTEGPDSSRRDQFQDRVGPLGKD